ncbi:MAG: globin domain-containing protein [candidate division Zixibacteria bacterium]|nr:globin domain-containing protein [candidate division Zixibacteria bacterium]
MALNVQLIRDTVKHVGQKREEFRTRFYEILFEKHPSLQSMFDADDRIIFGNLFDDAVNVIITSFEDTDKLEVTLLELGRRRYYTNLKSEHFSVFEEVLLEVLAEVVGSDWTREVESAWDEAIGLTFAIMRRAQETVKSTSD